MGTDVVGLAVHQRVALRGVAREIRACIFSCCFGSVDELVFPRLMPWGTAYDRTDERMNQYSTVAATSSLRGFVGPKGTQYIRYILDHYIVQQLCPRYCLFYSWRF